jgi:hypothetical protein
MRNLTLQTYTFSSFFCYSAFALAIFRSLKAMIINAITHFWFVYVNFLISGELLHHGIHLSRVSRCSAGNAAAPGSRAPVLTPSRYGQTGWRGAARRCFVGRRAQPIVF